MITYKYLKYCQLERNGKHLSANYSKTFCYCIEKKITGKYGH